MDVGPAGGPVDGPARDDDGRAARRAYIRAAHPDRGGDPDAFIAGLAEFRSTPEGRRTDERPRIRRSRVPTRVAVLLLRRLRRRLAGLPPRDLR